MEHFPVDLAQVLRKPVYKSTGQFSGLHFASLSDDMANNPKRHRLCRIQPVLPKSIALNMEMHKIFCHLFSIDLFLVTSVSGDSLGNACLEIELAYPAVLSLDR